MNDDKWLQQNQDAIRKRLDACVDEMDAADLSRLRQARQQALDSGSRKTRSFGGRFALPAGLAAATSLLLVILLSRGIDSNGIDLQGQQSNVIAALADVELLAAQEQTEFYENLDFYEWLLLEPHLDEGMNGQVNG